MAAPPPKGVVWIVDDSPLELEHAVRAFSPRYVTRTFADGSTMLERLASERLPDVLVLDWVMPGLTGIEICQFLRSKDETLELPILILTALGEVPHIVEGLGAGANDFLKKPFAPEELIARVDALIRGKRLRERAERAEANVRRLLANLPDPVVAVDPQGVVRFVNVEAELMLGEPAGVLLGRPAGEILPRLALRTGDTPDDGSPLALADLRIGEQVYAPMARRLGAEPDGVAITFRDVTHQRQAEARRLDFYSIVAHDLRAPLAAMILRIDVIVESFRDAMPAGLEPEVKKLKVRIRELLAMVDDFLQYARLEAPGFTVERHEIDLAAISAETVEDFRPLADAGKLRLEFEAGVGPARVQGDRRRLRQVLTNLIANAIKFTPPGGSVRVAIESGERALVVRVEDTGRGIAPEVLPGLFRRYVRSLDTEHEVSGTGLGLMIVRQLVEAHGGTVGVDSQPGRGSTFWFRLPALEPSRGR